MPEYFRRPAYTALLAMPRRAPMIVALTAVFLASGMSEAEARRLALVVGNADYTTVTPLKNAARDARDVAAALDKLGFEVTLLTDVAGSDFWDRVDAFAASAEGAESTVFFYSGHAFQMSGSNYLVPVDAQLQSRDAIRSETWNLDGIIARLQDRKRQTLILLDACRNDPLPQSVRGSGAADGLARLQTGAGTFVAFATEPGAVTYDGAGDAPNSPFTTALLNHIEAPGLSVSDMMIKVRNEVEETTLRRQTPWDQSSLREQFYFAAPPAAGSGTQELSEADYELLAILSPEDRSRFLDLLRASNFSPRSLQIAEERIAIAQANIEIVANTVSVGAAVSSEAAAGAADGGGDLSSLMVADTDVTVGGTTPAPEIETQDTTQVATATPEIETQDTTQVATATPEPEAQDTTQVATATPEPEAQDTTQVATATPEPEAQDTTQVATATPEPEAQDSTQVATVTPEPEVQDSTQVATATPRETEAQDTTQVATATPEPEVQDSTQVATATPETEAQDTTQVATATPEAEEPIQVATGLPRLGEEIGPPIRVAALTWETRGILDLFTVSAVSDSRARLPGHEITAESEEGRALLAAIDPRLLDSADTSTDAATPRALALAAQTELRRLGCYQMALDGSWGNGSRTALTSYFLAKQRVPDTLEPTEALVQQLKLENQVVCAVRVAKAVRTGVTKAIIQPAAAASAPTVRRVNPNTGRKIATKEEVKVQTTKRAVNPGGF